MKYLVTGGAGFIGSHLTEFLLARGHEVYIIDDLSTGKLENLANALVDPNCHFEQTSVTEKAVVEDHLSRVDVIIHLAAAVGVQLVVEHPARTIETNVIGTQRVLEAALQHRRPVLLASTSEVYGKGVSVPFCEEDDVLLGPTTKSRWSYAASKMIDEFLALAYLEEYGLPVTIFRLFNTVGPRQRGRYGMVVPRFVRQALDQKPITVFGDGSQTRCFCDVRDVVGAIVGLSFHSAAQGKIYNIGGSEEVSIRVLAERVRSLARSSSLITTIPYERAYRPGFEDLQRRVPDTRRIRSLLGWDPQHSLDETLQNVIEHESKSPLQAEAL